MASFNKVILVGNLTKDPELRYTPTGTAVCDLRMAVSRKYRLADGQEKEETCFVGVTVWKRQAETCSEYLRKGSSALVDGRLKLDEWEKDGQKHSRHSVVAERVQFLGSPRGAEQDDRPRAAEAPPAAEAPSAAEAPAREEQGAEPPFTSASGDDDNLPF